MECVACKSAVDEENLVIVQKGKIFIPFCSKVCAEVWVRKN